MRLLLILALYNVTRVLNRCIGPMAYENIAHSSTV